MRIAPPSGSPEPRRARRARATPLPQARGSVSRALITLLTGPPTRDPGILASSDVTDLWRPDDNAPWWEADEDAALALTCLDELDRRGLEDVSADWQGHPLLATARWTLGAPIRRGLEQLAQQADLPDRTTGCATVRLVLTMVATVPEPAEPPLARQSLEAVRRSVAVTAVQRLRERDAHLQLIPALAGASRQLLQQAALSSEPPGEMDGPRESIGQVLRTLGLSDRTGNLVTTLPGAALWRLAVLTHLTARQSLRAAALGWLVAAGALAASGRVTSGDALRAHGVDAATARAWDRCVIGDLATLEAAEHLIDADPALAPDLVLGALACLTSATAVESSLARTDLTPTEGLT